MKFATGPNPVLYSTISKEPEAWLARFQIKLVSVEKLYGARRYRGPFLAVVCKLSAACVFIMEITWNLKVSRQISMPTTLIISVCHNFHHHIIFWTVSRRTKLNYLLAYIPLIPFLVYYFREMQNIISALTNAKSLSNIVWTLYISALQYCTELRVTWKIDKWTEDRCDHIPITIRINNRLWTFLPRVI